MNELIEAQRPLSAVDIRAQVNLIQEVMQAVMKKETHYGVIPGCDKPSLWKPGAEKLLMTFHIASDPIVEDLSTADVIRYRVTRRGTTANGTFVGSGIGECSSNEEKYKWRFAACQAEFDATPEDRKRLKYKRDGSTMQQIRTNPADLANTVLKVADKRAYVALALNVTAASDIFTQDIEDLPEGVDNGEPPAPKMEAPTRKSAPAAAASDANVVVFVPNSYASKPAGKGTRHAVKDAAGSWYSTFSDTFGALLKQAADTKTKVKVTFSINGDYKNIEAVELA